jgi:hypothetical protein
LPVVRARCGSVRRVLCWCCLEVKQRRRRMMHDDRSSSRRAAGASSSNDEGGREEAPPSCKAFARSAHANLFISHATATETTRRKRRLWLSKWCSAGFLVACSSSAKATLRTRRRQEATDNACTRSSPHSTTTTHTQQAHTKHKHQDAGITHVAPRGQQERSRDQQPQHHGARQSHLCGRRCGIPV